VRTQIRDAVRAGGRALPAAFDGPDPRSMPAVFVADCPEDAALVEGDHFGPALAIVPVRDLDHALAIHHRIGQHLATSVFTRDPRRAAALAPRLASSHVTINESVMPTAHPAASLGGHGASGWGVSRGREGLLAMTRAVTVSRPSGPVRLPSDAPDAKTLDGLRRFIGFRYGGPGWRRLGAASDPGPPANPTPHRETAPGAATTVATTASH
jgi:aldehyde dehydrogenase (NAD+)